MNNDNGRVFTPLMIQLLIQELFAGQTVPIQQIRTRVDEVIRERGGQTSTGEVRRPVTHALLRLKQHGIANNLERGIWSIYSGEQSYSEELFYVETLGDFTKWAKEFTPGDYVFRGVPNQNYGIQASAYRRPEEDYRDFDKFLQINEDLIDEAKLRGYGERNGRKLMDLEILAELQHYGTLQKSGQYDIINKNFSLIHLNRFTNSPESQGVGM